MIQRGADGIGDEPAEDAFVEVLAEQQFVIGRDLQHLDRRIAVDSGVEIGKQRHHPRNLAREDRLIIEQLDDCRPIEPRQVDYGGGEGHDAGHVGRVARAWLWRALVETLSTRDAVPRRVGAALPCSVQLAMDVSDRGMVTRVFREDLGTPQDRVRI